MLDKMMEVAQQPPREMTVLKATILEGIKKRKKVDRELIRDFAVTLSATADRIADREGEDDYRVGKMRRRAEELFKLMEEEKPRLYEVRCHVVGTYC